MNKTKITQLGTVPNDLVKFLTSILMKSHCPFKKCILKMNMKLHI